MIKQNLLVIEDTPLQIRVLDNILAEEYNIKATTSGKKGIELAEKHPIDLILLDILMDDMDGFEVLSILKKSPKTKNIPVIFITSMDRTEDEVKGLAAGAVDYITKPFKDEIVRLRVGLHMQLISHLRTIENLSLYDSLTGIRNRRSFNLTLNEMWRESADTNKYLSMIMLDIDKFKNFNDKYGHLCGDTCLKIVAETLTKTADSDLVFRWGGEEFVIMIPGAPLDSALNIAEKLRQSVSDTVISFEGHPSVSVTISIGVGAIIPKASDRPEDFCTKVDTALYKAKENGRNRVEAVYNSAANPIP